MNLKDRIAVFDRDSKLLEEITSSYPRESEHHQALKRAVSALWYVLRGGHEFEQELGVAEQSASPVLKKAPGEAERNTGFSLDRSA